jgi:uncharacterized alpha-E superfamily protein
MQFPHSALYCLSQTNRYFKRLDVISVPENFKEMEFMLGRAVSNLRYGGHEQKNIEQVRALVLKTKTEIKELSQKLASLYFGYS